MKIQIQVKPNSKSEEVIEEGNGFIVRVKEPPVEGKANRAVIKLLAKHLGISETRLRISSGFRSKVKMIEIL